MSRIFNLTMMVTLVFATSLLHAEAIRQPPGLMQSDQYRLAFVTSTKTTAESSDIEFYNAFVQATADAAPEVGQRFTHISVGLARLAPTG